VDQGQAGAQDARPPGWYRDPSGAAGARWWDGSAWTDEVQAAPPPARPGTPAHADGLRAADQRAQGREPTRGAKRALRDGRRRRTGLLVGTAAAALLAVFLAGALAAWWVLDSRPGATFAGGVDDVEVVEVRVPALTGADEGGVMPDLRGLPEDVALEVLADAVPGADPPVLQTRPWAGNVGTVIEQRPAFGAVDPVAVSLVIAEAAQVPEVVGRDLDEVVDEFEALGTRVEVVRRFEAGTDTDIVLDIAPEPGEPVPDAVTVVASERASTMFLATVPAVDSWCSSGEQAVDGIRYAQALTCDVGFEAMRYAWLLNRSVESIEGTIGLPDTGTTDVEVAVRFLLDGEVIGSQAVSWGQSYPIELPTSGGLRFEVEVWILDQDADVWSMQLVLGDLRLVGGAEALTDLRDGT
jgi:hypothetical protein